MPLILICLCQKEVIAIPKQTFFNLPDTKRQNILNASIEEFAANGFDLSSIQSIIEKSGIPRGSFYQYFEDKTDIYIFILKDISNQKIKFMEPELSKNDQTGFFDFLKLSIKLGIKWAKENPLAVQIANDMVVNKTIDVEKLGKKGTDDLLSKFNFDYHRFFVKPIENSLNRGELSDDYSIDTIIYYTMIMIKGVGELLLQKNKKDPFEDECENLYDELLHILKYGFGNIKYKEEERMIL